VPSTASLPSDHDLDLLRRLPATIDLGQLAREIRICDRNYATAPNLHRFRQQSANQADFIVRLRWRGFSLSRPDGRSFELIEHLATLPAPAGFGVEPWPSLTP
jgi:hypothetical protein